MAEKKPTDILENEHRVIEKVVKAMAIVVTKLESGKDVDIDGLRNMAEFMRVFGDKCHHGKEEKELFPLLGNRGVPMQGCPISALTYEHEAGRKLVKGLTEATIAYEKKDKQAQGSLLKQLQGLADLYPNHIWKEDYLLFPMTNKILSASDQKELSSKFEMVEREIGPDTHVKYERLANEIEKKFNEV